MSEKKTHFKDNANLVLTNILWLWNKTSQHRHTVAS